MSEHTITVQVDLAGFIDDVGLENIIDEVGTRKVLSNIEDDEIVSYISDGGIRLDRLMNELDSSDVEDWAAGNLDPDGLAGSCMPDQAEEFLRAFRDAGHTEAEVDYGELSDNVARNLPAAEWAKRREPTYARECYDALAKELGIEEKPEPEPEKTLTLFTVSELHAIWRALRVVAFVKNSSPIEGGLGDLDLIDLISKVGSLY